MKKRIVFALLAMPSTRMATVYPVHLTEVSLWTVKDAVSATAPKDWSSTPLPRGVSAPQERNSMKTDSVLMVSLFGILL